MKCSEVINLLSPYLDGELNVAKTKAIENHLSACRSCRKELESLRSTGEVVDSLLESVPAPDKLTETIMAAVGNQSSSKSQTPHWFWMEPLKVFWDNISDWYDRKGQVPCRIAMACAVVFLIGFSIYVNNLEEYMSDRNILLMGPSKFAWNSPASLRLAVYEDKERTLPSPNTSVSIQLLNSKDNRWYDLYNGRTDARGTVNADFKLPANVEGDCQLRASAGAIFDSETMIKPVTVVRTSRILLSTDKPIYQPGQTIHMRALAHYILAKGPAVNQPITFEIANEKGTRLFRQVVNTSQWGIASADFELADEIILGRYKITAKMGDEDSETTITVKNYVLPKYRVDITPDKPYYKPGAQIKYVVDARYFFGKPVDSGRVAVNFTVQNEDTDISIGRITGKTDANGACRGTFTIPDMLPGTPFAKGDAIVAANVVVTDTTSHQERTSQTIIVAQEPFHIAVIPESGAPVFGLRNRFYLVASYPDGNIAKVHGVIHANGNTFQFSTDNSGIADVTIPVENDSLTIGVDATDEQGRSTQINRLFYRKFQPNINDSIILRTDKSIYQTGETLHATVLSRVNSTIYLDISRFGQTVLTKTVEAVNGQASLSLDLPNDLTGTLQMHAYVINSDMNMVGDTHYIMVRPANSLRLSLTSDKTVYKPGDEAKLHCRITDSNGNGVAGAVGLNIVDESVYALRETDPGLARDYFAMEKELLTPKYQIKAGLPASFYPRNILSDNNPRQRSAEISLASLHNDNGVQAGGNSYQQGDYITDSYDSKYERIKTYKDNTLNILKVFLFLIGWLLPVAGFFRKSVSMGFIWFIMGAIFLSLGFADINILLFTFIVNMMIGYAAVFGNYNTSAKFGFGIICLTVLYVVFTKTLGTTASTKLSSVASNVASSDESVTQSYTFAVPEAKAPTALAQSKAAANIAVEPAQTQTQSEPVRVRQFFPETLFWNAQIVTDEHGDADVTVPIADTITSWRASALASAMDDRLGSTTASIKVFQDFFVDLDIPLQLTQGDTLSVPVAIYNYLAAPQKIHLILTTSSGLQGKKALVQDITIGAHATGVAYFPIVASNFGKQNLQVTASTGNVTDAIKREIEVTPVGHKESYSIGDRLDKSQTQTVTYPGSSIPGTQKLILSLTPSTLGQVVRGLEGQLQAPYGCFEQTSSITYPNILILSYLKAHKSATPEMQLKAQQFIGLGYQRILSFEINGGGFDWFGNPPAKTTLTAYGVMELHDMANVYPVDENLIIRAEGILRDRQQPDGSWKQDVQMETWRNISSDLNVTAYITWALAYAQYNRAVVDAGLGYLEQHRSDITDSYTLALTANAFATARPNGETTKALLDRLDASAVRDKDSLYWRSTGRTLTYGISDIAAEETTALACQAFLRAGYRRDNAEKGLRYLIRHKSPNGAWSTTQATILAMQALNLADNATDANNESGTVTVQINGINAATLKVDKSNADVLQQVDLSPYIKRAFTTVTLSASGDIKPVYQLTSEWYDPGKQYRLERSPFQLKVDYDKSTLLRNEALTARITLNASSGNTLNMVMVDIGVPPGFVPDSQTLQKAVERHAIAKYQINSRQVTLYLTWLLPEQPFRLDLPMRAKYPVRAKIPPSDAYEYYTPSNRSEVGGGIVSVL